MGGVGGKHLIIRAARTFKLFPWRHFNGRLSRCGGYQEIYGDILAVHFFIYEVPDGSRHFVGEGVVPVLQNEGNKVVQIRIGIIILKEIHTLW